MRIVLATPPAHGQSWGVGSFPTLGLAYVAASVKDIPNVTVKLVDGFAEGLDIDQATERVLSLSPDMFGISVTSMNIQRGLGLLNRVKEARPETITILGGHHATVFDDVLLKQVPELDLVLRGETEYSFPELCRRLLDDKDLAGVPGLSYRSNGNILRGEPQTVEDLDSIPFPDRTVLEFEGYGTQWAGFHIPYLPRLTTIVSSRGCPYHCTFCAKTTPQLAHYRIRSAENVFQEVLELRNAGYRALGFVDENFSHDVSRIKKFCHMILEHKLKLYLFFQGSLHHLSDSVLQLMHRAGFDVALVGVESGSDAQLKRYQKPVKSQGMAAGIRRAKKAHMFIIAFFINGGPGETAEDHQATVDFIRNCRPHVCSTGGLMVHPGSGIWNDLLGPELLAEDVEGSRTKMIHTFPGQLDKETVEARIRGIEKAFAKSWLDWRRIPEVCDLLIHNRLARLAFKSLPRLPRTILQIFR